MSEVPQSEHQVLSTASSLVKQAFNRSFDQVNVCTYSLLMAKKLSDQELLFQAIQQGELVGLLRCLEDDGDPNEPSEKCLTPLEMAAEKCTLGIVNTLLRFNADPNHSENPKMTCLMRAAKKGCTEIVDALLGAGALVNTPNASNQTALYWAVLYGQVEVTKILIHAGADPELKDDKGNSVLAIASQMQNAAILESLQVVVNTLQV
jgi:ankyrin repeat protein